MSVKTKKIIYPVKLFCGILITKKYFQDLIIPIQNILIQYLNNEITLLTIPKDFIETDYYINEMGQTYRLWIFFENLINMEELSHIKNITNKIEIEFQDSYGNRRVNIDPGYLSMAKVVLASTKNYTHRIYIGNNIFAEVTLFYQNKTFNSWPWTYPDYKNDKVINFFNKIRKLYIKQLQDLKYLKK